MGQYFENENLPSDIKKINVNILNHNFTFLTDNGVFSKDKIDFGSRLLLESIPKSDISSKVLDVGCGYGTLGIVINKVLNVSVDMVDVNLRAIHLANRNIKENHCENIKAFESNTYENITEKYKTIITNPPIRAGKKVVYDILMNAKDHLEENGNLFLVIRKEQGAKSLIIDLKKLYNVEVIAKKKRFFIIKCEIPLTTWLFYAININWQRFILFGLWVL